MFQFKRFLAVAGGAAFAATLGACGDIVHPGPPAGLDDRMILFAVLNPDSTHHSVRIETADNMSRVELRELAVTIYKETSGDWTPVAAWKGDGRTSLCDSYSYVVCVRLEASLEPGAVYKVEAGADGRATASGKTTVVGDFQVEEAEMTGNPGARAIRASWTESTGTYRYLMALRRRDEFCANCTQAWYRDLEGTSYDGPVPQSAVDSAGAEPVLDVMASDEHFHAYLHSGHEGNFSSVQPVQNVVGGFGVVGSATYRSRKIDWAYALPSASATAGTSAK